MEDTYEEYRTKRARLKCKRKVVEENGTSFIDVTFPLKKLREPRNMNISPKTVLFDYCKEKLIDRPKYTTVCENVYAQYSTSGAP